jgi:hypothetical protein
MLPVTTIPRRIYLFAAVDAPSDLRLNQTDHPINLGDVSLVGFVAHRSICHCMRRTAAYDNVN